MRVNDYAILATLPVMNKAGDVSEWVIMGVRSTGGRETAVTARMGSLNDRQWFWGNYFTEAPDGESARHQALKDAYRRWREMQEHEERHYNFFSEEARRV